MLFRSGQEVAVGAHGRVDPGRVDGLVRVEAVGPAVGGLVTGEGHSGPGAVGLVL